MAQQPFIDGLPDICLGTGNKDPHHSRPSNEASCSYTTGSSAHKSVESPARSDGAEDEPNHPMSEMQSDASSSESVHDNRSSHFAGAHHFVSYGGIFNNILGNYMVLTEEQNPDSAWSLKLNGIIPGLPVLRREEVSPKHEIYKGLGYRFYSAQNSGRVVSMKLYEGQYAKQRCSHAAGFYAAIMHPNIPLLYAVSPLASNYSFLVFDGEYQGTVDYILEKALKKDLSQSLTLGLQTVIGLSSGLDYLQDQRYPFTSIGLEHFVLLSSKQGLIISFNPEELGPMTESAEQPSDTEIDNANHVLHIFNGLCQKTFNAARKDHYQDNQIRLTSIDEGYISDDDISDDEFGMGDTRQSFSDTEPAEPGTNTTPKSTQRRRRNGRRRELIWKSPADETITLNEISRDFQYFLNANASSLEPALNRRRGRYTARTPHRCPGYNRIEITLTPNITRSAIVFHSSPTPYEICPVCREVVKDAEIFNCICGEDDDESIPTVRCSRCFEWLHRPCVHFYDLGPQNFVCEDCKSFYFFGDSDVADEGDLSDSTICSPPPPQPITLPHRIAPTMTVAELVKKHQELPPPQTSSVSRQVAKAAVTRKPEVVSASLTMVRCIDQRYHTPPEARRTL